MIAIERNKKKDQTIRLSVPKEISRFNAPQVGHTVIKMYAIEKNINRKIGTEVENKGPKNKAILQTIKMIRKVNDWCLYTEG